MRTLRKLKIVAMAEKRDRRPTPEELNDLMKETSGEANWVWTTRQTG